MQVSCFEKHFQQLTKTDLNAVFSPLLSIFEGELSIRKLPFKLYYFNPRALLDSIKICQNMSDNYANGESKSNTIIN